jgi:hypothetical protein
MPHAEMDRILVESPIIALRAYDPNHALAHLVLSTGQVFLLIVPEIHAEENLFFATGDIGVILQIWHDEIQKCFFFKQWLK